MKLLFYAKLYNTDTLVKIKEMESDVAPTTFIFPLKRLLNYEQIKDMKHSMVEVGLLKNITFNYVGATSRGDVIYTDI